MMNLRDFGLRKQNGTIIININYLYFINKLKHVIRGLNGNGIRMIKNIEKYKREAKIKKSKNNEKEKKVVI
jgi:hypothetical protein